MALADLVQDAIIVMNGQPYTHPKYVGIIRKVDAGMVSAAGKLPPPLPPCLLFKKIHHLIPYIFSLLGFSMFFSLKLAQLLQEEGLQYLRSPPPVWLTRHLIGEGQNLQFCKLRWHLNKSAADQSWQLIPQTLNATLGTCQRISLRSSQKVLYEFVDGPERRSWSN